MTSWQTRHVPNAYDVLAPDTSEIRIVAEVRGASVVHCTLRPGQVSVAVRHRTVEEIWYVVGGAGELWRRDAATGAEEIVELRPRLAITLPLGTEFQFRATGAAPFEFVCVTTPPWPGADEAVVVAGCWPPTADDVPEGTSGPCGPRRTSGRPTREAKRSRSKRRSTSP